MLLLDEGLRRQQLYQPQSLSELFDVLLHGCDHVGGSLVGQVVELLDELYGLFEVLPVDGLLQLGEVVLEQGPIHCFLLLQVELDGRGPHAIVWMEVSLNALQLFIS